MGRRKIKNKKTEKTFEQEITGVVICFLSLFLTYGVFSRGHLGSWGNGIIDFFFGLLGSVTYVFPFFLFVFGIQMITKSSKSAKSFLDCLLCLCFVYLFYAFY